jgi:hypothetical protein
MANHVMDPARDERAGSNWRGQDGLTAGRCPDSLDDPVTRCVFEEVAHRARLHCTHNVGVVVVRGEDQHLGARKPVPDLLSGARAIQDRHPQVHQHHVRVEPADGVHRLLAVGGVGHYVKADGGVQQCGKAAPDHRVVVGNNHRDGA